MQPFLNMRIYSFFCALFAQKLFNFSVRKRCQKEQYLRKRQTVSDEVAL